MCKPIKDYLGVIKEYKAEIFTFLGFACAIFIYLDFREVAREQAATSAKTTEILRTMDIRLSHLEHNQGK